MRRNGAHPFIGCYREREPHCLGRYIDKRINRKEDEVSNGNTEIMRSSIPRSRAERLSATLGFELSQDDAVPRLWHYLYFWPEATMEQLGEDGHPVVGVPVPPGPGMRRMFAGTSIRWQAPLGFGVPATRVRAVVDTQTKQGRTGELVFMKVRDVYTQSESVCMTETQTIVYRSEEKGSPRPVGATVPENATAIAQFSVDERSIFRYSALTFNTHRIHYDQRWARHEGYSDIVVQGPLQATLLARARNISAPQADADLGVDIRFSAPVLGPQQLTVYSDPSDAAVCLTAGADGRVAATARWISRDDEPQG